MLLEKLYSRVEAAAENKEPLHLDYEEAAELRVQTIASPTGIHILITNLYWRDEDNNIYQAILEPATGKYGAGLFVCGNWTLDGFSSGQTNMFRKNLRYHTSI